MKLRRRYLPVAAVLGAAVAIVPALATAGPSAPSEAKLEVNQNCYFPEWPCWNVKGNNPGDIRQIQPFTIAQGGTISFEDNDSKAPTDVIWKGAAPSCTAGVPETPPTKTGWSGTCTFANAGDYEFESQELFNDGTFNYTKYKVIVEKTGGSTTTTTTTTTAQTTTTTTPTTQTTTTTAPTTPSKPSHGSALKGGSRALKLAASQHGSTVHGQVKVSPAGAGGRLEVGLFATAASLPKVGHPVHVRVGRLVRSPLQAGSVSFAIPLSAKGKAALRRHHRLRLTVKITLTPQHGAAVTLARVVVMHARS